VATHVEQEAAPRIPLSRRRVFQAAVKLADAHGIEALTMRRLAEELGAEAMSLYHHVANKEQVLDGVVEVVAGEINDAVDRVGAEVAKPVDWKGVVRRRILAAREVMLRHKWAPSVFESRTSMNPEVLRYHDALVGIMHAGGFTAAARSGSARRCSTRRPATRSRSPTCPRSPNRYPTWSGCWPTSPMTIPTPRSGGATTRRSSSSGSTSCSTAWTGSGRGAADLPL
jgi:AcrR family transcriptional regulator